MTPFARKSDGRRIFTNEFKRKQIARVWRGEVTLAELGRRLGIARSLLQRWKALIPDGRGRPGAGTWRPAPAIAFQSARYIRELQLVVGKQTVELELLNAELLALRNSTRAKPARHR